MKRRAFLGALVCASHSAGRPEQSRPALRRGIDYLSSRQDKGGGWHSATYGLLRSGQSLTPLVVNALLDAGEPATNPRIKRALTFLERYINSEGGLGLADDASADYPCYATALALRAFIRAHGTKHRLVPKMIAWLRSRQMSPENSWRHEQPAFGAWGIGASPRRPPDSGHVDLSMTRHVLEALVAGGVPQSDPALQHARVFVERCRNADGGFFFSTVETGANKAGETHDGFLGYGTATADGIIALACTGAGARDAGAAASLEWLRQRDHPVLSPGFDSPARRRYAGGLRYYYADAATRAFRLMREQRAVPFASALEREQRPDGSWINAEILVKEDDPLIATSFALSALAFASLYS
jgi:hypothetical protein